MTEPHPAQLPVEPQAGNTTSIKFTPVGPTTWLSEAFCKHGTARSLTRIADVYAPVPHAAFVEQIWRHHDLMIPNCDCPRDTPVLNATATFQVPLSGVQPGQQRYIPQTGATMPPPAKNVHYGPGLTCSRAGAYQIEGKVQLSRSLAQGAGGLGVILISGQPVHSVPMVTEGGKATANINVMLNLAANQSVAVGYENTSTSVQDVTLCTLTVSEVWVPS